MEPPGPSTVVITNTYVRELSTSRDVVVGRNEGLSHGSCIEEIDERLGNEERTTYVSLEDIDTSKDNLFGMSSSTAQSLVDGMDDTFSSSEQHGIQEDIMTSIIDMERESLLKKLSEIQNKLPDWQLKRLIEVLGNATGQETSLEFDRTLQFAGKYIDKGAANKRKRCYQKIDPLMKIKLNKYFEEDDTPSRRRYEKIGQELGLTEKYLRTWFKNERSRQRRLAKELQETTGFLDS